MISEKFKPTFDWLVGQGIDRVGLEKKFRDIYEVCGDILDFQIKTEELRLPEAWDYSNVRNNTMMKVVVMDVLTDVLQMDIATKEELMRAMAMSNWHLHLTKRPQDYPEQVPAELAREAKNISYNRDLLFAAGPWFFESNLVDVAGTPELLMLLGSDLVDERKMHHPTIMAVEPHINELKRVERDDLKQPYWDRELAKDKEIMSLLFPDTEYSQFPMMILNHLQKMVV